MAVFLARMVMPRSRSSSLESMTRSATCSLARKVPAWRSMASTRVVLPWSTCAMMAILRIVWFTGAVIPLLGFGAGAVGVDEIRTRCGPECAGRDAFGEEKSSIYRIVRQISLYQLGFWGL